jgi:hypothetical protein
LQDSGLVVRIESHSERPEALISRAPGRSDSITCAHAHAAIRAGLDPDSTPTVSPLAE